MKEINFPVIYQEIHLTFLFHYCMVTKKHTFPRNIVHARTGKAFVVYPRFYSRSLQANKGLIQIFIEILSTSHAQFF